MGRKILIIGAGWEQVPAIEIAREMGYEVYTSDFNPKAPGMELAHHSFVISTNDLEGNAALVKEHGIDGVMTICSETAIPVVGGICERFGLPGINSTTALQATNKGAMQAAMEAANVAIPARLCTGILSEAEAFLSQHTGPWVIKPSDSSGQRATVRIDSPQQLAQAFSDALGFSTDNQVLIDQFVEGTEINVTATIKEGEITTLSLANRIPLPPPNFGIAITHLAPPTITDDEYQAVDQLSHQAIRAIGLNHGIAYPQIMVTSEGPKLIEIAARMPGGFNREMAINLSGVDMIKAQIMLSMGEDFTVSDLRESPQYSASCVKLFTSVDFPEMAGKVLHQVAGLEKAKAVSGVQKVQFNLKPGDKVPELENSGGRFAAIIAVADNREQVEAIIAEAKNHIQLS